MFPLVKPHFHTKCFSLQIEVLSPKCAWEWATCPFLLKGNALHVVPVNWRIGAARFVTSGGFDLKLILLVKYAVRYFWFPFAQEAAPPGYTLADPHCHLQRTILRGLLYAMQKPICYSSKAFPSHLACPSLAMTPSSRERTRGLIKNKGDLFFDMSKCFISLFPKIISHPHFNEKCP